MKKVYKILPLSIYDIPGIESWLEEQANSGFFPVFLNSWVAFTPTGVPGTRFRLVAKERRNDCISPEQIELYQNAGWQYAASAASIYFLFYTTDPKAVEVYSDWDSWGVSLQPLKKRLAAYRRIKLAAYSVLAAVLIWALFFFESKYDVQPDHFSRTALILLELFQPAVLLLFLCAVWIWKQAYRDKCLLHRICDALSQGMAPPPSKGPSKAIVRDQIIMIALVIPLAVFTIIGRFDILNPWAHIPIDRFSEPYLSIQSIEQEPVLPWDELFDEAPPSGKPENYAEKKVSLLSPVWYAVTQEAYSPQSGIKENYFSPKPENGIERYSPDLDGTYCHLLLPSLARPVAEAQLDAYRLVNLEWSYEELSYPGLDFVIHATETDGIWQMLAIGKNNSIAVFRYAGKEWLPDHLRILSETVVQK